MIGKKLLHYRIIKKLGAGGQGAVYKALNTKLDRTVVIKVLPPELTVNEANLKRFEREARLASSLDHPNICTIFDLGVTDGLHFIVMQYIDGLNVRELVNGRPLELKSALTIGLQVCEALAAAHERGIIHRDVKANNIMVTETGQAKMLDFGLAKLLDDEAAQAKGIHQTQLTEIGVPYGTATYAAPEQAQGQPADARADIFSTGVLLYEMLTGKWPFRGKTLVDVRYAVLHDTPQPISEARPEPTPSRLQEILDLAMAKDPRDRYQSITELRDDLRSLLHEISASSGEPLVREITSEPPRHLGGSGPFGDSSGRARTVIHRNKLIFAAAGLVLISLIVMALLFSFRGKKSALSVAGNDDIILRLHGSNTIGAKLAPALAEEFLKQRGAKEIRTVSGNNAEEISVLGVLPGDSAPKVIEIQSHGSSTAFADLLAGRSDVGLSSRKIKPEEIQSLSTFGDMISSTNEHILALDGIAVIVNSNNPIESLTIEQVAKIFSGEITSWTQVLSPRGKINVYARDDKSGTFDSFKSLVLGGNKLVGTASRFEDSLALSEAVASDPDGIGFVGLPYIRNAKAVAVSDGNAIPLLPNRLTVATEDYILSRRLYLYTPSNPRNKWVSEFVDFALSKNGQDVVANIGFVAQNVKSDGSSVAQSAPEEYKKLTKGAERLSLNFRFRKGGKDLDNKARLDLDRVVNFITDLKLTGQNILLFGFADDGGSRNTDMSLSKERAMEVAEQFKHRGVSPTIVMGFGSQLPVASNATDEGKEKNRRVEIWLRK